MGSLLVVIGFIILVLTGFTAAERPLFYVLGSAAIFVGCSLRIEAAIRGQNDFANEDPARERQLR
jgi:hypothetical protein